MSALRTKLHALIDEIVDAIEGNRGDEWVDQRRSPLGRNKHLSLAKRGVLPASKEGRQVLIKRSDIDRYLDSKALIVVDPSADQEREVARVLSELARGRDERTVTKRRRKRS